MVESDLRGGVGQDGVVGEEFIKFGFAILTGELDCDAATHADCEALGGNELRCVHSVASLCSMRHLEQRKNTALK